MSGTFQPIYPDDAVLLQWNKTLTAEGTTATNYVHPAGSSFSITIPASGTTIIYVQANNAAPFLPGGDSAGVHFYASNPLLNQPSMAKQIKKYPNPSFSGSWVTIDTILAGASSYFSNKNLVSSPIRYIRLLGNPVTAAGFAAYVWSENYASYDVRFSG